MDEAEQQPPSAERKVMLLVDDDELFLYTAQKAFTRAGFEVVAANDAMKALDLVERLPALHCMVLDIVLPEGTPHGLALANMVHSRFPRVVSIFISGFDDAKRFVTRGTVFTKPVDLTAIVAKLRESL
jgi:ActR/RegA family two-component response regulator